MYAIISKANKMAVSISIRGLKKYYPQVKGYRELLLHPFRDKRTVALDGVNLEIESGRCFFLLGPNGAGKTTLLKVLATLLLPDEGSTSINGYDVEKEPEKVKDQVGYAMCDERSFYWRLTGRQNLEFYAALNNIPPDQIDKKINEVLELTNLSRVGDNRFDSYSTGMKQMMSIARALLSDPNIVFVDEPTKSLDPQAAKKMRRFLSDELAGRRKHTVIWTSHDLAEVSEFGYSMAIIDKGKIKFNGMVSQLNSRGAAGLEEAYIKALGD